MRVRVFACLKCLKQVCLTVTHTHTHNQNDVLGVSSLNVRGKVALLSTNQITLLNKKDKKLFFDFITEKNLRAVKALPHFHFHYVRADFRSSFVKE